MRRKITILLFSFFAITAILPIYAQLPDYHVQVFDEKNGIYTYQMQNIIKDENEFIWILYRDRIQRFDGKRTKEFALEDRMNSMICDRQNRIWAASRAHIFRYRDDRKGFEKIDCDTSGKTIIGNLLILPGQPVIMQANDGFYAFDSTVHKFKKITKGVLSFSKPMNVTAAAIHASTVFVLASDSVYSINTSTGIVRSIPAKGDLHSMFAFSEDRVLVSYWEFYSHWYDFKTSSMQSIDIGTKLNEKPSYFFRVYAVDKLNEEEYLFAAYNGVLSYNTNTDQFRKVQLYTEGKPLRYVELFRDIHIDKKKNVWCAFDYGLVYFRAEEGQIGLVRNSSEDERLSWNNNVRGFAEDEKGNLWMATGKGFAYYDLQGGNITAFKPRIDDTTTFSFPSVRGIAYDGRYVILGPTDRGVWLYHLKNKKFYRPFYLPGKEGIETKEKLEKEFIDHLVKLRNGDFIFSARYGFYLMKGKSYVISQIHFPGENENGNFSYQDSEGKIWMGTREGLHCFDSSLNYLFKVQGDIGDNNIESMLQIKPGEYLAGAKGLYTIKHSEGKDFQITKTDAVFDKSVVYSLFMDKQKKLWVGTNEGLIKYDLQTAKAESYNYFDNLQGNEYNPRSIHLTNRGILFLGGFNGVNYLVPEKVFTRNDSLRVIITKTIVNSNDTSFSKKQNFKLKYFQNSVEVDFVAPYFKNPNRVLYRYWLQGLDDKWVDNGNSNTIRFTALSPGNYHFKIAASIDNEHWFESGQSFSFVIRPPFWNTWWFRSLAVILIAASVYTLYRYQLNKRLEVERLRSNISRDLHDDIGSTLSSINILSKSSLTQYEENGGDLLVLQKIQQRSQKMLDAMDDLIWNTKPENDSLESLIVRMREYAAEVLEAAGIRFALESPEALNNVKLNMQQRKNLYLIFKEAVNNLAKYSKTKKAFIRFEQQKKYLRMVIIDEGTGFTITSIKKGNGLDNMQSRAAEMNAQLEIRSGENKGTTISLDMPV